VRPFRRSTTPGSILLSVALTVGLVGAASAASPLSDPPGTAEGSGRAARDRVVVVAVGDIACRPGVKPTATRCQQAATAELAAALDPDAVLALGDNQYEAGSLRDYRRSYARSWGDLRGRTYPIPGNHEYKTAGASGYYTYFAARQPGAPGYYAFDLADWRVYALNSNCSEIRCRKEYAWLRRDLRAHPRTCSLFTMHHPRFSSGREHGSNPGMSRFLRIAQNHDVDLVLAGHDHDYERFRRMTADGTVDRNGVLSIVSGAGGKSLYPFAETVDGSAYRQADSFGVLRLALRARTFRFAFKDVDGTTPDAGTRACR
jgi:3',5'-cyclic AMP phosphodiesterase CpdA